MNKCLDNLNICRASCCKWLPFYHHGFMSADLKDYYEKHGCKLERIKRDLYRIIVPCVCPQLDPVTCLCKLHGTAEKPKLCVDQNEETIKTGRYYLTEGCIYKNDK